MWISCWEPWAHVKQAHHTISTPCIPLWGLRFAETGIHLDLRCEFASQSWCKGLSRLANLWHAPCSQPSWLFLRKVNPLDYDNTFVSWLVGQSFGNKLKLIILIFNEEASSITLYENNLNRWIYQGDHASTGPILHAWQDPIDPGHLAVCPQWFVSTISPLSTIWSKFFSSPVHGGGVLVEILGSLYINFHLQQWSGRAPTFNISFNGIEVLLPLHKLSNIFQGSTIQFLF